MTAGTATKEAGYDFWFDDLNLWRRRVFGRAAAAPVAATPPTEVPEAGPAR